MRRVATALCVAALATAGSLYLFVVGGRTNLEPAVAIYTPQDDASEGPRFSSSDQDAGEYLEPAPEPLVIRTTVDHTCSIKDYLLSAGLDAKQANQWAEVFGGAAHTKLMRRGHQVAIYKDPETGELRGLQYDVDDRVAVEAKGLGGGVVLATQQLIKYFIRPVTRALALRDGFEREAARQKIPRQVSERLEEAFGQNLTGSQLRAGAALKLIYEEQVSADGTHRLTGDIRAAQLRCGDRTYCAFSFRDERGRTHLYDETGKPLGPNFLRFPLPFEYISSGFSNARYHPLLHRYRPHVGVDLVAKYGAPVRAVADGRVESAEWSGELGRCIRVSHQGDLISIYGHLSKVGDGIKPGSYVRIGQVIGWVGTTGLSTGPHLHFALFKRGAYVNPLTVKLEQSHEIAPRLRSFFSRMKQQHQLALAKLPDLGTRGLSAGDRKPAISSLGDRYHVEVKKTGETGARTRRVRALFGVDSVRAEPPTTRVAADSSGL